MTAYRLIAEPSVDLDVEAAFEWYEKEQAGLGVGFLDELRATYNRITEGSAQVPGKRSVARSVPHVLGQAVGTFAAGRVSRVLSVSMHAR